MKVLIVHDYGTLSGGAEQVSILLRDGLRRSGHEARLFASAARPLPVENLADYVCHGSMSRSRKVLQAANPWAVRRLRAVLHDFLPDIVHLRMFLTQLSPFILRPLREFRTLLHVGSYELICPLLVKTLPDGSSCRSKAGIACYRNGCVSLLGGARTIVQTGLRRRWLDSIDLVVANSEWTRSRLVADDIGVSATVWNGVPLRPPRQPLLSPPTAAYAGRLVWKKGVDVLVRAMASVVAARPDARLIIAGDGPERPALEQLIRQLRLESSVLILGHRSRTELEDLFAGVWVQVVPSRWEDPFPNVAAEAMMRGTAVVASKWGGLTEIVRDGLTGMTVPPGDPGSLGLALRSILNQRDLAEAMGAQGRAFALAELTEDRFLERFLALYHRLRSAHPDRHEPGVPEQVSA